MLCISDIAGQSPQRLSANPKSKKYHIPMVLVACHSWLTWHCCFALSGSDPVLTSTSAKHGVCISVTLADLVLALVFHQGLGRSELEIGSSLDMWHMREQPLAMPLSSRTGLGLVTAFQCKLPCEVAETKRRSGKAGCEALSHDPLGKEQDSQEQSKSLVY